MRLVISKLLGVLMKFEGQGGTTLKIFDRRQCLGI